MIDIVLRMKALPDLTNEKAWEVVYEGAREIERLRALASQYRDDMRYPPSSDSCARRIAMIDNTLKTAE